MILIADSGSTKTDWTLLHSSVRQGGNVVVATFHTQGITPVHQTAGDIRQILTVELLPQLSTFPRSKLIELGLLESPLLQGMSVFFYGSGCTPDQVPMMSQLIAEVLSAKTVEVHSDLTAAARALCQHEAGIACILGTGANSCLYDGKDIKDSDLAEAGGHTLTINYCGHQYRQYTIEIYDHEPPVFTKSKSVYTFATLPLPEEEFDNLFEAEDNSGKVDIEYDVPDVDFNTPGEYKIIAVATDPSGNKAESEASIYVQEPSYGAVGTYVYVSIPDQHLTYFKDSKPVLDCPVVTGNAYGHSTPTGTYTLNYKARNIILKGREDNGTEYQSFVSYWMAFIGSSYGLHDATWRTNFGGSIYQGSGSHGCVNMPYASAAELYEMIEPGVPVLIY